MVKTSLTMTPRMSEILFATRLYKARIAPPPPLGKTCLGVAAEDKAGQRWSREHGYGGYTSYASLNDLPRRASLFDELEQKIARHVSAFARELQFDLGGKQTQARQSLDQCDEQGRGAYAAHPSTFGDQRHLSMSACRPGPAPSASRTRGLP